MCISVSPGIEVSFSNTILYGAEVVNPQGKIVHVLGYQNVVQNNIAKPPSEMDQDDSPGLKTTGLWNRLKGVFITPKDKQTSGISPMKTGNAMILPFPAISGTMSQKNVIETKNCPDILKDMSRALLTKEPTLAFQSRSVYAEPPVQIFEAAGIYTVILAQEVHLIPEVIDQVPEEKRPELNPALFKAFAEWYPGWTIALCCFNNEVARQALPLLWWYEPMFPEKLFLPALDCHTGEVPDLQATVKADHTIAVGSGLDETKSLDFSLTLECFQCGTSYPPGTTECVTCKGPLLIPAPHQYRSVSYSRRMFLPSETKPYLLPRVMGQAYRGTLPNGDFVCQIADVRKGTWKPVRIPPLTAGQ